MKTMFTLLIASVSFIGLSAMADNPDQAESDKVYALFASFTEQANRTDVAEFPAAVKCGENRPFKLVDLFKGSDGKPQATSRIINFSKIESDGVVFNFDDGDQVDMLKLKIRDLKALKAEKVKSIEALEASGYWWSDGDHVTASSVSCK